MDTDEPKFKAAFERVTLVVGLVVISLLVVGAVVAYLYFGLLGLAAVGIVGAYAIFEGASTSFLDWLVHAKQRRRELKGLCLKCGYDLRGSRESKVCPECGEPIATLKS